MDGGLQEDMRAAVRTRVDIMWLQNESIYQAFVRPQLSPETADQLEAASD